MLDFGLPTDVDEPQPKKVVHYVDKALHIILDMLLEWVY